MCILEHMSASMQNLLDQFINSPQVHHSLQGLVHR